MSQGVTHHDRGGICSDCGGLLAVLTEGACNGVQSTYCPGCWGSLRFEHALRAGQHPPDEAILRREEYRKAVRRGHIAKLTEVAR